MGYRTFVLDGDNVRHGLSSDLGFSNTDRRENIRRIGEVAKLMTEAGVITLAAFISPFINDRSIVRHIMSENDFIEIYCEASLEICEERDVKGLYQRARDGQIKNYTGISSPYEKPISPELTINTAKQNVEESVNAILKALHERGVI